MVEHNQSANVQFGVGYDNKFKFNDFGGESGLSFRRTNRA